MLKMLSDYKTLYLRRFLLLLHVIQNTRRASREAKFQQGWLSIDMIVVMLLLKVITKYVSAQKSLPVISQNVFCYYFFNNNKTTIMSMVN